MSWRHWAGVFAALCATLLGLAVLFTGVIAYGSLSVDAQRLREPIAAALTRSLGREVEIAGSARLTLSLHPTLIVHDVRIANPAGLPELEFATPDFATIAELRLDTDLLPLLRRQLIVHELRIRGTVVRLARSTAGRGNWSFTAEPRVEDAESQSRFQVDWRRVVLEQAVVEHALAGELRSEQLDSVVFAGLGGQQLRLVVQGEAANLAAEVELAPGLIAVRELGGQLDGVEVSGEFGVDTRGQRPRISGRLTVPQVDIGSGTAPGPDEATDPPTLAALYAVLSESKLNLGPLAQFDAELDLTIGRLVDSPGDVQELSASIGVDAGRLNVPFTATIGGAPFAGAVSAEATGGMPSFALRLSTSDAPIGGLALLLDLPYVVGTVQRFGAEFSASGFTPVDLMRDLAARIRVEDARLSYGNYEGGRPIDLHIAAADVGQARGQSLAATVRGSLRGKAFEGSFDADTLEHILRERQTAFRFTGSSAGVQLRLAGSLSEPGADSGPDITVDLSASQARELAPWLGFSSRASNEVAMSGHVRVRENGVKLEAGSLVFGRSSLAGELEWHRIDGKARVGARLAAGLLDPAELRGLWDTPVLQRTLIDLPILPEALDFGDVDLELTVQAVHGLALDITDLAFSGRMRSGAIEPSLFALQLQGNELAGTLALDTRGASPTASIVLEGADFDAGLLVRHLRLAEDIEARVGKLRLQAAIRGSRLGQLLEQSSLQASFAGGAMSYRDAGSEAALGLAVASGELRVEPGGPVKGSITGSAGGLPVQIDLEAGPLGELLAPDGIWPFSFAAVLADAQWVLSGSAAPGREPVKKLSLSLSGKRLSDLGALLTTSLPPWGPYAITGNVSLSRSSYRVDDLRIAIADSLLLGSGSLDTGSDRPRLEAVLLAPVIQLDDFLFHDWSPLPQPEPESQSQSESVAEPTGRMTTSSARQALASGVGSVHPLFGRQRLALADVELDVRVEQILAGEESLGHARIAASVIDGAATLGPIEFEGRAGRAKVLVAYEPREHDAVFSARALLDRLDYGLVLARFDPVSGINGVVSLDLAVDAVAPELNTVMQTASGHMDFAVWPDRVRWGGFDLWASNLMRSLLPFFSPAISHVNCVTGQVDLEQGLLASRALLVDTTNTRAVGEARADFATERLRMRFVPSHKRPRLVSLAVPVEVRGTFSDYRISLRPADAPVQVAQWFKALAMVPLHWLGVGRIPRDGRDVCAEPARPQDQDKVTSSISG